MTVNNDYSKQIEPVEKLPDGTVFYSYDYSKEVYKNIVKKKFILSDIVLMLLYSQFKEPICGRVSLMKQLFLLIEEVLNKEDVQNANFIAYRFGMYSFSLANVIENLDYLGLIEIDGKKNTKLEKFYITEKGMAHISKKYGELDPELQVIIRYKRKGWDQLGYKGILRLVYQKYPKYKEKSEIKEKYKAIKWGRGIG